MMQATVIDTVTPMPPCVPRWPPLSEVILHHKKTHKRGKKGRARPPKKVAPRHERAHAERPSPNHSTHSLSYTHIQVSEEDLISVLDEAVSGDDNGLKEVA